MRECLINLFSEDVLDDQGERYMNRICFICQYSLAIGDVIIVPKCRHWLHKSCFVEYKNDECPLEGSSISKSYEEVVVNWAVDNDDDVVEDMEDIATVGVRDVGVEVGGRDSVARDCSVCRVLYLPGVLITMCMECGETFCTSCVIVACPLCDARAFATHYALSDVQGHVPVQGPVVDALFDAFFDDDEYPIGGDQGPVDDDPFEYPTGDAQTLEQVLEAAGLVPSHLFVIGDDSNSDSDVVEPFGDYAVELRGGAAEDEDEADRV